MANNDLPEQPKVELTGSRQFTSWLVEQKASLAFTTYQSGKLFLIGMQANGHLSVFERTFNRCMGLAGDAQTLWMSTLYQLWRLENALAPGQTAEGYDRFYIPRTAYTTGDLDIHDIGIGTDGRPVFIATLFGCVATLSETHSIRPLWKPPFISRLAAEDRCHLNGLAMADGSFDVDIRASVDVDQRTIRELGLPGGNIPIQVTIITNGASTVGEGNSNGVEVGVTVQSSN